MSSLPELLFYDVDGPLAIAHRGGDAAGAEKENSLVAFDSAYNAGILYGETDTVATADGIALAFHGSKDERARAKTGLPLRSELQKMTLGEIEQKIRIGGEKVPTLEEVLVTFPGMRFFIDPKTAESVRPLADLINRLNVHNRVSIGAFSYGRTKAAVELVGENRQLASTIGALGGLALLGNTVKFPLAKEYLKHTRATQFALPFNVVTSKMAEKAHDLGLRMILWTPNEQADIETSFDKGADGVMSDRTHLLKAIADLHRS